MHTPEQMDLLLRHEQIFGPIWLECGPGWTALLDELCTGLQRLTDDEGAPQVVAQHVKEKLGGMRFYCRRASESQRALIEATKARANVTCETCSDPGSVYVAGGWLSCKCPTHAPEGGMLRVEAIADRERRAREAEAQQQAEKGEGGE